MNGTWITPRCSLNGNLRGDMLAHLMTQGGVDSAPAPLGLCFIDRLIGWRRRERPRCGSLSLTEQARRGPGRQCTAWIINIDSIPALSEIARSSSHISGGWRVMNSFSVAGNILFALNSLARHETVMQIPPGADRAAALRTRQ